MPVILVLAMELVPDLKKRIEALGEEKVTGEIKAALAQIDGLKDATDDQIRDRITDPTIKSKLITGLEEIAKQPVKASVQTDDAATYNQSKHTNWTMAGLAFAVTLGFLTIVFFAFFTQVSAENKDLLNVLLGALGTAFITIINFYFGSSAGSKAKDIANMALLKDAVKK